MQIFLKTIFEKIKHQNDSLLHIIMAPSTTRLSSSLIIVLWLLIGFVLLFNNNVAAASNRRNTQDDKGCVTALEEIYLSEASVIDISIPRGYILCSKSYYVGDDFGGNNNDNTNENNVYGDRNLILRSNAKVSCQGGGGRCRIIGSVRSRFAILNPTNIFWRDGIAENVTIQGISIESSSLFGEEEEESGSIPTNLPPILSYSSYSPGSITFLDCIFLYSSSGGYHRAPVFSFLELMNSKKKKKSHYNTNGNRGSLLVNNNKKKQHQRRKRFISKKTTKDGDDEFIESIYLDDEEEESNTTQKQMAITFQNCVFRVRIYNMHELYICIIILCTQSAYCRFFLCLFPFLSKHSKE